MTSHQYVSLRDKQVAALYRMLDLHNPASTNNNREEDGLVPEALPIMKDDEPIWKVLILDKTGMSIVSSVLRVADLRAKGITIHLSLTSRRATIPDVRLHLWKGIQCIYAKLCIRCPQFTSLSLRKQILILFLPT